MAAAAALRRASRVAATATPPAPPPGCPLRRPATALPTSSTADPAGTRTLAPQRAQQVQEEEKEVQEEEREVQEEGRTSSCAEGGPTSCTARTRRTRRTRREPSGSDPAPTVVPANQRRRTRSRRSSARPTASRLATGWRPEKTHQATTRRQRMKRENQPGRVRIRRGCGRSRRGTGLGAVGELGNRKSSIHLLLLLLCCTGLSM